MFFFFSSLHIRDKTRERTFPFIHSFLCVWLNAVANDQRLHNFKSGFLSFSFDVLLSFHMLGFANLLVRSET